MNEKIFKNAFNISNFHPLLFCKISFFGPPKREDTFTWPETSKKVTLVPPSYILSISLPSPPSCSIISVFLLYLKKKGERSSDVLVEIELGGWFSENWMSEKFYTFQECQEWIVCSINGWRNALQRLGWGTAAHEVTYQIWGQRVEGYESRVGTIRRCGKTPGIFGGCYNSDCS